MSQTREIKFSFSDWEGSPPDVIKVAAEDKERKLR